MLLYYLVTPIADDPLNRHRLLGKVLQVLYDNSILRGAFLKGSLSGTSEQLRVNLEALTLEELSLVWDALNEPYQLSVTYLVQLVKIDSDLEPVSSPLVVEKEANYMQILNSIVDPVLRMAWIPGSWEILAGQFFQNWDPHGMSSASVM